MRMPHYTYSPDLVNTHFLDWLLWRCEPRTVTAFVALERKTPDAIGLAWRAFHVRVLLGERAYPPQAGRCPHAQGKNPFSNGPGLVRRGQEITLAGLAVFL